MIPAWLEAVLAVAAATGLMGMIGPWLSRRFRAGQQAEMEEALATRFATRDDVNRLGEKVSGAISLAQVAATNADRALDVAGRIEQEHQHSQERIASEVLVPLREIVAEQKEMGKSLAAVTALLERLTAQVDREFRRGDR